MFKSETSMYKFFNQLFKAVEKGQKLNTISIKGYTRMQINEMTYQCIESNYIDRVEAYRDANGDPHFNEIGTPCVSLSGYRFWNDLRSHSALNKARSADLKGWISVVIAFLTFFLYFIEQSDSIQNLLNAILK